MPATVGQYQANIGPSLVSAGTYSWPLKPPSYFILIFTHLKLCLAIATHNFKWVEIAHIGLIWDQTFANLDVWTLISLTITVIWSTNKAN